MSQVATLLVELVTEELPPKALRKLSTAFAEHITEHLKKLSLCTPESVLSTYATPRRLALLLTHVLRQAPEQNFSKKLMPSSVGFDGDGQPTAALIKKLNAKGWGEQVVNELQRINDGKTEQLVYQGTAPGLSLEEGLQQALSLAITKLPIPKVMSYQLADGHTSVKFVRPAHALITLHGADIIPTSLLGLTSSRQSLGHRFQGKANIDIQHADGYEQQLAQEGHVMASFDERKNAIMQALTTQSEALNLSLGNPDDVENLLEEVTALVEYPCVYLGEFDAAFLNVPPECLTLTMRLNQKYFPLFKQSGQALDNRFLIVSNMTLDDAHHIIEGNQRVIRPRLADAQFFFDTDKKTPLAARVEKLETIIYHNQLGTQRDRSQRVASLCERLALKLNVDPVLAKRAAELAKADLSTGMVGEFPELQGLMGSYYAKHDGEDDRVAQAIAQQYQLRFDEELNDQNTVSAILFAAERIETLVSIWSIGLVPSGDKDPYGLRRAALGLISVFEKLPNQHTELLAELLQHAAQSTNAADKAQLVADIEEFIYERYRHQLTQSFARDCVDAVVSIKPALMEVKARLTAVETFKKLSQATNLAAANKRIGNILKKSTLTIPQLNTNLLLELAEKNLAIRLAEVTPIVQTAMDQLNFNQALIAVAELSVCIDDFFDQVMVMAEEADIRANRLALLQSLFTQLNAVADISRLES